MVSLLIIPPVGHRAETGNLKTLSNPLCYRNEGLHIRGVAWPHLATNGSAVIVENNPDHHLVEVRPMVLAIVFLPRGLSSFHLKVKRGGIEEDRIQPLEKMPLAVEEVFFDN